MNGLQRVLASITGSERDFLPVSLTLSLYGAGLINCPLNEYYTSSDNYVDGQSKVKEILNPDILFAPFVLPGEGEIFGSEIKYFKDFPPNLINPIFSNSEDFFKFNFENIFEHSRINYLETAAKDLVAAFGSEYAIASILLSPCDLPIMLFGLDKWLQIFLFEEEAALPIIDILTDYFVTRANRLFDLGAHFIAIPIEFVNTMVLPKVKIQSIVIPKLIKAFSQVKGPIVFHHGGFLINDLLDIIVDLPNVIAFMVDPLDKLRIARERLGANKVLMGNLDPLKIGDYSESLLKDKCLKIINDRKNDKNFVFTTSGPDIPLNTPIDSLKLIIDTVRNKNCL